MDGGKKEKNRMRGSFASRILLISILFLVIPLLILVGFLYMDDLRVKKENNLFTLKVIMNEKVTMIDGIIEQELTFLGDLSYLIPKLENPEKQLQELAKREGVEALFHIKQGSDGRYVCDLTSKKILLGQDFTGLIEEAEKGIVFILDPMVPVFYLTYFDKTKKEGWVTVFLLNHLTQNFPIEEGSISPASTSLVDHQGTIVLSTNDDLEGYHFHDPIGKSYLFEGEKYISLERDIPETNFSLLISAPEEVNFVATPYFFLKVTLAVALIGVLGGGGALLLTRRLSKPLRQLTQTMGHVGRGDLTKRFAPQSMGFEINELGEIFNDTVDSLSKHMEEVQKERVERKTYEKELLIGEEVQLSILPKKLPEFPGVEMAARFIAAKEVGGDFYDLLPNGQLMISIADTSGKGISACLYSLSVRSMLRSYGEIHQTLDAIIKDTNNLFCHDTGDTGVFVTAFIAFFDPTTKVFHYSNCGHFPAYLQKGNGELQKLTTEGMALGVVPFDQVATDQITLQPGDTLLLFTDGVVEAHNESMEMFGEERLIKSLFEKKDLTPNQIVDQIIEELALFAKGCPQFDDLTLLAIKIT